MVEGISSAASNEHSPMRHAPPKSAGHGTGFTRPSPVRAARTAPTTAQASTAPTGARGGARYVRRAEPGPLPDPRSAVTSAPAAASRRRGRVGDGRAPRPCRRGRRRQSRTDVRFQLQRRATAMRDVELVALDGIIRERHAVRLQLVDEEVDEARRGPRVAPGARGARFRARAPQRGRRKPRRSVTSHPNRGDACRSWRRSAAC